MKIIGKAIIPLFLVVIILTSCNGLITSTKTSATVVMETAMSVAWTEVTKTQVAIPTVTAATMLIPTVTPLSSTETPLPIMQSSPVPVSGIPTIVVMGNGLTWTECVAPNQDYTHSQPDMAFATSCFKRERPLWNDNDRKMAGERIEDSNGSDLQQIIGSDIYLVKHDSTNGCCDYKFLKNENVIMKTSAPLITFDPNRNLWNIGGNAVWELITDPPTIIVDGINLNEKYQLEGAFIPYTIHDKLIYIAKENEKYHIVYDEKIMGPQFDEIYIKYCCATTKVLYGEGQYWFWGKREGTYYVVGIQ